MWTVIIWAREPNQWVHMHGFSDEDVATENAEQLAECYVSCHIVSLSDPTGEVVWAEIGSHPVIGRCDDNECWCYDHPDGEDHSLECAGHEIGKG